MTAPERIYMKPNDMYENGWARPIDTDQFDEEATEYVRADLAAVQPAQVRLSIERKIGMYGAAYDGPQDARAYTYEHTPSNQHAWCIGEAASNTAKDRAGDYIDVGLSLLRHLSEQGFGVFSLNKNDALEPQPDQTVEIDLRAAMMDEIKKAASESPWVPKEYYMNEVISDCCAFLREDRTPQPDPRDEVIARLVEALEMMRSTYPYNPPCYGWQEQVEAHKATKAALAAAKAVQK